MANPRNVVDSEGIGRGVSRPSRRTRPTIVYDGTQVGGAAAATLNKAVSLSAAGTVQLASDGEAIIGKLVKVEGDNKATVQTEGLMAACRAARPPA